MNDNIKRIKSVAVVGLGYVGLPLSIEFSRKYKTIGFDIDQQRVRNLQNGRDTTGEMDLSDLPEKLSFSSEEQSLEGCDVFVISVPTPVDDENRPNLSSLIEASKLVGRFLKAGGTVVYESTVFPGATEEFCVPVLESAAGLTFPHDFQVGYSPERINPGDKDRSISQIVKITSGSDEEAAQFVDALYSSIIEAGTYLASSIKVAEAAKVIENTQRDLNIALVNELAVIFDLLEIDTHDVLAAAGTKWNFLKFHPGLVGGHCIGVDPFYLTYRAERAGYKPDVILAGRKRNDTMGKYVVDRVIRMMIDRRIQVRDASVLVLGVTFKENCSDVRNSQVLEIVGDLSSYGMAIDVCDPHVNAQDVLNKYQLNVTGAIPNKRYDVVLLTVAHDEFSQLDASRFEELLKSPSVVFDVKGVLPSELKAARL